MPIVPSVVGATLPAALNALQAATLTVANTTVAPSSTVPSGGVVNITPAVGTNVAAQAGVDLVISSGSGGWKELLAQNYQSVIFNTMGAGVLLILAISLYIGGGNFYTTLADQSIARGLITFLITATSAALFIILAISTVVASDAVDADKRFDRSKQILTMLVGILGTIIGFYFGTATNASSPPIRIIDLRVDPQKAGMGETFTISGTISGGKAPYIYSIIFDPKLNVPLIADRPSPGKFSESIAVPGDLVKDEDIEYSVTVKDADGKIETIKGERKISLKAGGQPHGAAAAGTTTQPMGARPPTTTVPAPAKTGTK
jgi:PASTA domain